eukprot:1721038-Pleurochrysis_carterae.AAC.9
MPCIPHASAFSCGCAHKRADAEECTASHVWKQEAAVQSTLDTCSQASALGRAEEERTRIESHRGDNSTQEMQSV